MRTISVNRQMRAERSYIPGKKDNGDALECKRSLLFLATNVGWACFTIIRQNRHSRAIASSHSRRLAAPSAETRARIYRGTPRRDHQHRDAGRDRWVVDVPLRSRIQAVGGSDPARLSAAMPRAACARALGKYEPAA